MPSPNAAVEQHPRAPRFALVAVGGYGRGELSPHSDIDLIAGARVELELGSKRSRRRSGTRSGTPVLKLGHAVRSLDDHLALAKGDLDTATALLTARPIAGDRRARRRRSSESGRSNWTKRKKRWLAELQTPGPRSARSSAGDVAYILEPDLKDGHGGIRDAHSLWWAECGGLSLPERGQQRARTSATTCCSNARVALHRATGRPGDTLRLEDQDAAAAAAGLPSADALMAEIAAAARTVAWIADEAWGRVGKTTGGSPKEVAPGRHADRRRDGAGRRRRPSPSTRPTCCASPRRPPATRRGSAAESLDRLAETVPQWPAAVAGRRRSTSSWRCCSRDTVRSR